MFRIGHGYDVHRFDLESAPCTQRLGGVDVPTDHALLAHSDGDVVLHAVCDALLGAVGLGDIGEHFPDTEAEWSGADSTQLLAQVVSIVHDQQWRVVNLDVTIQAQAPKLSPFKGIMKDTMAALLKVESGRVNVKATTTEKLGFVGRKEGIAVDAVCLLEAVDQ